MSSIRYEHRQLDVACELDGADAQSRVVEWRQLREDAGLGTDLIAGGARLWLRPEAAEVARDLARRESACCGFLDLELVAEGNRLRLDVTSPVPEAGVMIGWLLGLDAGGPPC